MGRAKIAWLGQSPFRSLRIVNYRIWAIGALVSNIGTWMQRTGQDWLVLTELTHRSGSALGIVMALQFGPQLLFLPWTGVAADYFDRRKLLSATQALMGLLAVLIGVLTVTGLVQLWHVYVFAFLFGAVSAFDAPVRQAFVSELVGDESLANAVALNSTSFNLARMVGPAVAGLCIAALGTGWAFLINGVSFFAVLASVRLLRTSEIHFHARAERARGGFMEAIRYLRGRSDLVVLLSMIFLIGTFGMNFQIYISTMAVTVFGAGSGRYGLLASAMAVGTTVGALLAAGRDRPRLATVVVGAAAFAATLGIAAAMPGYWSFAAVLVLVGISALTVLNSSSSLLQLSTDSTMRGRVIAIRMAIAAGGTPVGAPLVGWVADRFGPRWSLAVGACGGLAAALLGLRHLWIERHVPLQAAPEPTAAPPPPLADELVAEELIEES